MQVWYSLLFISIPLSVVQIDGPATPVVVGFVVQLLSYYIHSPVDVHFGPLRKLLVDNRFHRIHHSLEPRHFDRNFGICFSIWDRWFGTAYDPASNEWPDVGLQGVRPPRTISDYLLLPFRRWPRDSSPIDGNRPAATDDTGACVTSISSGSSLSTN
jgi:sterol desaturase/sphingolipid hydroxylase (fatty acid hydroxylase superfamily)